MIRTSLLMAFYLTVLTGIAYPLLMTGIGTLFFRDKAAGSLIVEDGRIVGSRLIGQELQDGPDERHHQHQGNRPQRRERRPEQIPANVFQDE